MDACGDLCISPVRSEHSLIKVETNGLTRDCQHQILERKHGDLKIIKLA